MEITEKAKKFAIMAHFEQVRKSEKDKPMIIHPIDVAYILKKYGFDDNVVAAGYLHDVIEDTKYTKDDIYNNFGEDILSLVMGDTEKDKSLSWEERKEATIEEVKKLDLRHKAIVCADKISNLEDLIIYFAKFGKKDFSCFKRSYEKQKWYYESIYESLIYNEDENIPMFVFLKDLIDEAFTLEENNFVKDEIFKGKQREYKKLKNLHFRKVELMKLKRLFDLPTYVIEFTGTPRTGKTTLINNLKDFFKKGGFKISVLEEFTTSEKYKKEIFPLLKDKYKNIVNIEIPKYVRCQLEDSLKENNDIIIVDRSLFDRLIWVERLHIKNGMDDQEYNDFFEEYTEVIKSEINSIIATYTDSLTSLKRDYNANLSLEKRNFLSIENVNEYNEALLNVKTIAENKNINVDLFDTTSKSERTISMEVADKLLTQMREFYLNKIKIYLESNKE